MKKIYDYWIPDIEVHFPKVLKKNFKACGIAEYQFQIRNEAMKYIKNFDRCVDVGANLGLWSKPLCKLFNHVISFEPLDFAFECLEENTKGENITLNQFALGNTNDKIDMIVTDLNTGRSHVDVNSLGKGSIEIKKMDNLNLPYFSFIKLDCEGYEAEVLKGGMDTIKEYKPVIVTEDHNAVSETQDILVSLGLKKVYSFKKDHLYIWE